jgi:hypothetical protein
MILAGLARFVWCWMLMVGDASDRERFDESVAYIRDLIYISSDNRKSNDNVGLLSSAPAGHFSMEGDDCCQSAIEAGSHDRLWRATDFSVSGGHVLTHFFPTWPHTSSFQPFAWNMS